MKELIKNRIVNSINVKKRILEDETLQSQILYLPYCSFGMLLMAQNSS